MRVRPFYAVVLACFTPFEQREADAQRFARIEERLAGPGQSRFGQGGGPGARASADEKATQAEQRAEPKAAGPVRTKCS